MRRDTLQPRPLCPDCRGIFSAWQKESGEIELLCLNSKNELIYLLPSTGQYHTVTRIDEDIEVLQLRLFELGGKTHFIYSARYHSEIFLIFSPLNNNAMPKTLIKLHSPQFCLNKSQVYLTAQNGTLGYIDLLRPEPPFNRLTDGTETVHLFSAQGVDMLVYKKGSELFFQNRPVASDPYAEMPILFFENGALFLMWRSRGFILYRKSTDSGRSWSGVGRILTPDTEAVPAYVWQDGNCSVRYIEISKARPRLLGSAVQSTALPAAPAAHDELEKLRSLAQSQKAELLRIKKELDELKKHISQTELF